MNIVIFAGGAGRRLWPISRKRSPKQFEPIIGEQSTLQLAVGRVEDMFGPESIYISTNAQYVNLVAGQLPQLPRENFIAEPARRDLAAAVGLAMAHLVAHNADAADEPVAILWGDNYMDNVPAFRKVLLVAEQLLLDGAADILFIGETPRFANANLGWLGLGEQIGKVDTMPYYRFNELRYRPALDVCRKIFADKTHVWNTGYFVTTPAFVQSLYAEHQPEMAQQLARLQTAVGQDDYPAVVARIYPELAPVSFDDAILQHIRPEQAVVLHEEMGWSDPGTLYALKEAINPDVRANVTKGLVVDAESSDCLIYNYESDKLVAAVGLEGMIVVNTEDAILVVHKDQIPLVKQLVNDLEGTDLDSYS